MSTRYLQAMASALLLCLSAASGAEGKASQSVIGGISRQNMDNGDGGTIDVDWVRNAEGNVLSGGLQHAEIGVSRWTILKLTATQKRARGAAWSTRLDVGPGWSAGDEFTFVKLGFGLSGPVAKRWRLYAQETYVDVEPVSGHLVAIGGVATYGHDLSVQLETSGSVGGTLDEHGRFVRLDYRAKVPRVMAGVSVNVTNDALRLGAPSTLTSDATVRQTFVGLSFPVKRKELTVLFESGKVGAVRRDVLSFFVKSPLKLGE